MAFIVSTLTDYTREATRMLRETVLFSEDYQSYNIQEGISYKDYINYLSTDVQVGSAWCDTSSTGQTYVSQKVLTVGDYPMFLKYCYNDLAKKALHQDNFEQELVLNIIENIKEKVNSDFWVGKIASGHPIDGILTQLSGDSSADSVTTSGTGATLSTIITHINSLIAGMADKLWAKRGKLTIHVPIATYNMYRQALALSTSTYGTYVNVPEIVPFSMWVNGYENQIKIKGEPGFTGAAAYRAILISDDNIFIGVDELQTISTLDIINDPITDNVYFKAKFKFGVTYLYSDEVVILKDS